MTKMAKIRLNRYPIYDKKRLKSHTLWGSTNLYSPYKGVPPGRLIYRSKRFQGDKKGLLLDGTW